MKNGTLPFFLLLSYGLLNGQQPISLKNPSFEVAGSSKVRDIAHWVPCGMEGETPPDVQPGNYDCTLAPAHGDTYLGMVTRDNHTWEAVSQKLSAPLDSGICYTFTVQLATSEDYNSFSRTVRLPVNYNAPVVLQIWGGYEECGYRVLLGESPVLGHRDWKNYRFVVRHLQRKPLTHIVFQAYYPPGKRCQPTMGNLLLDNLSEIIATTCPTTYADTTTAPPKSLPLESEKDLNALLIRELAAVRYEDQIAVRFVFQCEDTDFGALHYGAHFAAAARAIEQFPDKKLILRPKNASKNVLKRRAAFLEKYLLDLGLAEAQFEVKPYNKKEEANWKVNTSWLCARW